MHTVLMMGSGSLSNNSGDPIVTALFIGGVFLSMMGPIGLCLYIAIKNDKPQK